MSAISQLPDPAKMVEVVRFRAVSSQAQKEAQKSEAKDDQRAKPRPERVPEPVKAVEQPPQPRQEAPKPKPISLLPPKQAAPAPAPAQRLPQAPAQPNRQFGPPDRGGSAAFRDTPRVSGAGPNGEPLYAAAWYREPGDSELSGYLSTAHGPGWGLIACRTAPDYHVEDCVLVDEYPAGSNIARAVLAAAWQFQVRPPRVGGQPQIGAWVRIRIDYGTRER